MSKEIVKITINGKEVEAEKGAVLIDVCRENAENIPSFCYYKDLEPQASCRMCLVRIEKMPKLQTSCTIKVTDGMVVTTKSAEIEKAQRAMGEFLLANHPLDCPVCDRGGECELQEVIFDWGDLEERFTEYKNVKPEKFLSPIVANDPQRCILCKRCTRVCHEWMGEDAIEAGNRGVNTVIGTYGGWLNCSQCGNCIEVCPTGTLLDGVYRHATRPWELDQTISTDVYGSDGMQISIGSRGGEVHRIVARDRYVNGLNGEFLDVRARFAHQFINHEDRIRTPLIRYKKGGKAIPATWDEALKFAASGLSLAGDAVAIVASPRLTNESLFALRRFAEAAKIANIAVSDRESMADFFANLSAPLATHNELRYASTIVLFGGEPEEEQTFTAKQIRQAVRNSGAKLIVINERPIRLRKIASQFIHLPRGGYDLFALALFGEYDESDAAAKLGLRAEEIAECRRQIAETAGDLIVTVGSELTAAAQALLAGMAARWKSDTRRVLLHPLPLYNNSVGAIDIFPSAKAVAEAVASARAVYVAGSVPDPSVLAGKEFVIVQELFETETTDFADVILPAASFAEIDGTFTNNAGNVQRVRMAIDPVHQSRPDWLITASLGRELGLEIGIEYSASAIFRLLAAELPAYSGLRYPLMSDESNPARANHSFADRELRDLVARMRSSVETFVAEAKNNEEPRIGHRLHRVTTMTGKTPQFHLLAHGNPKPKNLLVSPLEQFELDGTPKEDKLPIVLAVGADDRE